MTLTFCARTCSAENRDRQGIGSRKRARADVIVGVEATIAGLAHKVDAQRRCPAFVGLGRGRLHLRFLPHRVRKRPPRHLFGLGGGRLWATTIRAAITARTPSANGRWSRDWRRAANASRVSQRVSIAIRLAAFARGRARAIGRSAHQARSRCRWPTVAPRRLARWAGRCSARRSPGFSGTGFGAASRGPSLGLPGPTFRRDVVTITHLPRSLAPASELRPSPTRLS